MGLLDIFKVGKIKSDNEQLQSKCTVLNADIDQLKQFIAELGVGDALFLRNKVSELKRAHFVAQSEYTSLTSTLLRINTEIRKKEQELTEVDGNLKTKQANAAKQFLDTCNKLAADLKVTKDTKEKELRTVLNNWDADMKVIKAKREKELGTALAALEAELKHKQGELIILDEALSLESFALYTPKFGFTNSLEYRGKLEVTRADQKKMLKDNTAASGPTNWTVNNSAAEGRKMVSGMTKLLIRAFNNECDYCVDNVKFNNLDSFEKRIRQAFDAINKLAVTMRITINIRYMELKLTELYLSFEYQQKKQEEKEEQRLRSDEIREQAKVDAEIKRARDKIEKERKQFTQRLKAIDMRIALTTDVAELHTLEVEKCTYNETLSELLTEEKEIDYKENNAKAGYVYVISNIGSFGEGVYKIGMTRRVEPQDRVDELGGASVPFRFDTHAMVFSANAPELENQLHKHFYKQRVNKLNNRKEFFKTDIKDILEVLRTQHGKVLDAIEVPPAEQYRESLLIKDSR